MSSQSTATSPRLTQQGWHRVLEAVPEALSSGSNGWADYMGVFLESSRHGLYRLALHFRAGRPEPARTEESVRYVEGASVTMYDADHVDVAEARELTPGGLISAASSVRGNSKGASRSTFSPPDPLEITSSAAVAEDWPDELPRAWIAEATRSLAEMCLDIDGVVGVDVSVREDARRVSLFDVRGLASCRREQSSITAVRCLMSDGRELRAATGGSGPARLDALSGSGDLPAELAIQAEARRPDSSWLEKSVPIVFEAGWCAGTWLHEAVGHFFEADVVAASGFQLFREGERVGPASVNILDDPLISDGRGSLAVDDEGVDGARTVLIRDGVVCGRLHSRQTARRDGVRPTGNGRRQDFSRVPIPRMTNLIMDGGSTDPGDLLRSASKVLFVREIGHASVNLDTGRFRFDVLLGHVVESGAVGAPVTGFSLHGDTRSALDGIRAVGNDFATELARGTCLKKGQVVPVGLGSPSILVGGLSIRPDPR